MLLTKVPQYIVPFWYGREPMFWLPYGWFPYYAEWIISFPRAPLGSVSAASWQLACSGVVTLLSEIVTAFVKLVYTPPKRAKIVMPAVGKAKAKEGAEAGRKKEL